MCRRFLQTVSNDVMEARRLRQPRAEVNVLQQDTILFFSCLCEVEVESAGEKTRGKYAIGSDTKLLGPPCRIDLLQVPPRWFQLCSRSRKTSRRSALTRGRHFMTFRYSSDVPEPPEDQKTARSLFKVMPVHNLLSAEARVVTR